MKKIQRVYVLLSALLCVQAVYAQHTLVVKINEPKADIQPAMWGVFFEDINFGADGGIYAELVKNRSFEFLDPMMGWVEHQKKFRDGAMLIINRKAENPANPRYIRVTASGAAKADLGLTNEGFRGMGIKKDMRYDFSVMYHQENKGIKIHVELADTSGKILGGTVVMPNETGSVWHKIAASFTANATELNAVMNIWFEGSGVIDLDMISLFPSDTWKNRPGGMRADMVQKLADLKPGFMRFPGGCIVEGFDLNNRYQWKKTIGPLENRQLIINRWNTEFAHRPAPDYFQTFGLGFFEYFQLAEDIGAEPLPILNCGMACQFNSGEVVPLNDLDPYVQDALDLVEFANGDIHTTWGRVRADMGHPAPFSLKMMGVGNEQWGPQYLERNKIFTAAIKAKYPEIKLINSVGPYAGGEMFNFLNDSLRGLHADLIDEHYYMAPEWFLKNAGRYDDYPRNETKIFAGEYAAHTRLTDVASKKNNWQSALAEAAFMTGLERNADVVSMASYAPLFAHADGWQWAPDLIWVNNLQSYGSPSYYVQQMFSLNKGTKVIPVTLNNEAVKGRDSLYASACIDANTHEVIIKLVNASGKEQSNLLSFEGVKKLAKQANLTILQSNDLSVVNSFAYPTMIAPQQTTIDIKEKKIVFTTAAYSLSVLKIKML